MIAQVISMVIGAVALVLGVIVYTNMQTAINTTITPASTISILNLLPLVLAGVGALLMLIIGLAGFLRRGA